MAPEGGNNNPPAVHFLHHLTTGKKKPAAEHELMKGRVSDMADPSRSCWQLHWHADTQLLFWSWLLKD